MMGWLVKRPINSTPSSSGNVSLLPDVKVRLSFVREVTNSLSPSIDHFQQIFDHAAIQRIIEVLGNGHGKTAEQRCQLNYKPLEQDDIGLLELTEDPQCPQIPQVVTHNDRAWFNYVAVSYTWLREEYAWYGERLPEFTKLRIDGNMVVVPSHVAFIIGCLFLRGAQWVWIDCLCINQNDREERGHQVSHMNRIFQNAEEVAVFLGKPTHETNDTLRVLCNDLRDRVYVTEEIDVESPSEDPPKLEHTNGFRHISEHKYWSRAWILQEIALARKLRLICGEFMLDHYNTTELIRRLIEHEVAQTIKMQLMLINKLAVKIKLPLLDIMTATRYARCSEPRDAIYAKMHLANDKYIIGEPDYSKSTGSLFRQFAIACILESRSLRILSFASGYDNGLDVASWVPDWTPREEMPEMRLTGGYSALLKDSMRKCTARVEVNPEETDRILVARGWVLKTMQGFGGCSYETYLCLVFGCTTLLVLARRGHNYVLINFALSNGSRQSAQAELDEITLGDITPEYPITEFRIA